jgi:hypothetical protein
LSLRGLGGQPGVGTALGARIGSAIGKLLGSQPEGKRRLAPVEK